MKRISLTIGCILVILILSACENKTLIAAHEAVDAYNEAAISYNDSITDYNDAVALFETSNTELDEAIDNAQSIINQGEEPYDTETLLSFKAAIADAQNQKQNSPSVIESYSTLAIDDNAGKKDLEALITLADSEREEILTTVIPDVPTVPDYTSILAQIDDTCKIYQDSIQSLRQVTNPSTDFVIDRLQTIPTILAIDTVTEDNDPNGQLNKQGGYTGCVYFSDSQVDRNEIYIESGFDSVIDIGTTGGGCLEIFENTTDAERRETYLAGFDGTMFTSGSHYIFGTVLVRTSYLLTGTQQKDLTNQIEQALIKVQK